MGRKIYIRDAATYNLVEGKIQITKLKMMENLMKKSINIGEEKITMPNVKEGLGYRVRIYH
jgi:hypothetical protein